MGIFDNPTPEDVVVYAQEAAMIDASELIAAALERSGMSRAQLAKALGISRSEVTARLTGERNVTVRKLAETLHCMGMRLELSAAPIKEESRAATPDPWSAIKGVVVGNEHKVSERLQARAADPAGAWKGASK